MRKTYNTPTAVIVEVSTESNLLAGSVDTTGPAAINDRYTGAEALSNRRLDIWGDDEVED